MPELPDITVYLEHLERACLRPELDRAFRELRPAGKGGRSPFTRAMRERYEFEDEELRALQYYISQQIVLERVAISRSCASSAAIRASTRVTASS